jgi:hypothetical protein
VGRVLETVIVCVCLLALAGWMAWQWLFSGEDDRLTGAPAFSTRRRRDILTLAVVLVVTLGGALGFIAAKLVQICV